MTVYDKIEDVLRRAQSRGVRVLAPHEFEMMTMPGPLGPGHVIDGREYVGCSESALGRRLREMRGMGRVTSATRTGKAFKEFGLVVKLSQSVPARADEFGRTAQQQA